MIAVPSVEIPLSRGMVALIDECDVPLIEPFKWYAHHCPNGRVYAIAHQPGCRRTIHRMHRLIMGLPLSDPRLVDHRRAADTLDNRRCNLRIATFSQNQWNSRARGGTSAFKGVSWCSITSKWRADVCCHGKKQCLGRFDSEEAAAAAYDQRAKELFGEFARTNF